MIVDDYAHHPTAVTSTLEAAKRKFPGYKIFCLFQPHTFSRTEKLLKQFGTAFKQADKVIITEIFGSVREKEGKVTSEDLVKEIKKSQSGVRFFSEKEKILSFLDDAVKGPTIIITMGAGDIYKLDESLIELFLNREKNE